MRFFKHRHFIVGGQNVDYVLKYEILALYNQILSIDKTLESTRLEFENFVNFKEIILSLKKAN